MGSPTVLVASLEEADELLSRDPDATSFPHIISISHTKSKDRPQCFPDKRRNILYLTFADVDRPVRGHNPPTNKDIFKILEFARNNALSKNILVHCFAGISRSTAAATIMHAFWLGQGNEQLALDRVAKSIQDREIRPNALMIKMGDTALGCGGKLVDVVKAFNKKNAMRQSYGGTGMW